MADNKLDVRVYPIDESQNSTRAFASVSVDDLIAIRGIRVFEGENGFFVSMPQVQDKKNDEYHDVVYPSEKDLLKAINKAVLGEYKRVMSLDPNNREYEKTEASASAKDLADIKLDIQLYPLKESMGKTKAFATLTVDETIVVRGVRVVEGAKGLFVTMPQSHDKKTDEYHDIAFPLNGDLRKEINRAVLEKFTAGDKSKDKSLADGLKEGAEKAAAHVANPKNMAAKSRANALG